MESSSTPLAEYFWIAGIESITYDDAPPPQPHQQQQQQQQTPPLESTIVEDGEPDDDAAFVAANGHKKATARHSRQNSGNRLSKISLDGRLSIQTLDELEGNTSSNRSSATIRPVNAPNGNGTPGGAPGEGRLMMDGFDFDEALLKFAAERETFLEDLSFSAGAKVQSRPPMVNPRAGRIRAEDSEPSGRRSPLKNIKGSIRRKMSFRDMNSVRKQPSTARPGGASRTGLSSQASIRHCRDAR